MARWRTPERRTLPLPDWPEGDRRVWTQALRSGGLFDKAGRGARWAPATRRRYVGAYGRWLTFLSARGWLDAAEAPAARIRPDRVDAYVGFLAARIAAVSVWSEFEALHNGLWAMAPKVDLSELRETVTGLRRQARLGKRLPLDLPPIRELYEAGLALMAAAEQPRRWRPRQDSVWFRDGLMIAVLAVSLLRRRNLMGITLGKHLQRLPGGYWLAIPTAAEVKNRRPVETVIPERLTPLLDRYLQHHRPRLLQGQSSDALWISKDGLPLSINAERIKKATRRALGRPVITHLFRHCAATSIALEDPVNARSIRSLLVHANLDTGDRYYKQAGMVLAGRDLGSTLMALREDLAEETATEDSRERRRCAR